MLKKTTGANKDPYRKETDCFNNIHPSISGCRLQGQQSNQNLYWETHNNLVHGLPWGFLPVGHPTPQKTGTCPGCILTRCLNHLNWHLLMQRSNNSPLSTPIQYGCLKPVPTGPIPYTLLLHSNSILKWNWVYYKADFYLTAIYADVKSSSDYILYIIMMIT